MLCMPDAQDSWEAAPVLGVVLLALFPLAPPVATIKPPGPLLDPGCDVFAVLLPPPAWARRVLAAVAPVLPTREPGVDVL